MSMCTAIYVDVCRCSNDEAAAAIAAAIQSGFASGWSAVISVTPYASNGDTRGYFIVFGQ